MLAIWKKLAEREEFGMPVYRHYALVLGVTVVAPLVLSGLLVGCRGQAESRLSNHAVFTQLASYEVGDVDVELTEIDDHLYLIWDGAHCGGLRHFAGCPCHADAAATYEKIPPESTDDYKDITAEKP